VSVAGPESFQIATILIGMEWATPPVNKVYEALGAIGDGRMEVTGNTARVYSSSRNKFYEVSYDPESNTISSNDNASYYVGYLGYPAIAFLLICGLVDWDPVMAEYLAGFRWKDINQRFKNDFAKTDAYIDEELVKVHGIDLTQFHQKLEKLLADVMHLKLMKPASLPRPPKGY